MPRVTAKCALLGTLLLLGQTCLSAVPGGEAQRSRVIVLSDIGNEPDDSESMVRLLVYANELEIEGLVATTSTWQKEAVHPEIIEERVRAYGVVLPNLRSHANGYPDMETLLAQIKSGQAAYGMSGVGVGGDSPGSEAIISAVDRADVRPVWVLIWGGARELAQALTKVRRERSAPALQAFVAKLRVYSISDQDDAGPWVRLNFPQLFWIASIHAFSAYANAAWPGISGDIFFNFDGPDSRLVSHEWLAQNIRKGPLGALYPDFKFIMEGDTSSLLYVIPNGLGSLEHPEYGSWGGRYGRLSDAQALYTDTTDTVVGVGARKFTSNKATIWRWREAYQNDFAARIQWSLTSNAEGANHNPELVVNGATGREALILTVPSGGTLRLSAAGSRDPDGDPLKLRWFEYREPGTSGVRGVPLLEKEEAGSELVIPVPRMVVPARFHLILEGRDGGTPNLFSYRRVIVDVTPK